MSDEFKAGKPIKTHEVNGITFLIEIGLDQGGWGWDAESEGSGQYTAKSSGAFASAEAAEMVCRTSLDELFRDAIHPAIAYPVHGMENASPEAKEALNRAAAAMYATMTKGDDEKPSDTSDDHPDTIALHRAYDAYVAQGMEDHEIGSLHPDSFISRLLNAGVVVRLAKWTEAKPSKSEWVQYKTRKDGVWVDQDGNPTDPPVLSMTASRYIDYLHRTQREFGYEAIKRAAEVESITIVADPK